MIEIDIADHTDALDAIHTLGIEADIFTVVPWVATDDADRKLFFVFWETTPGVAEMHIACPRASVINCRELTKAAMNYVFELGFDKIETRCPPGKPANMAKKLGMRFTQAANEMHYFEVVKCR